MLTLAVLSDDQRDYTIVLLRSKKTILILAVPTEHYLMVDASERDLRAALLQPDRLQDGSYTGGNTFITLVQSFCSLFKVK